MLSNVINCNGFHDGNKCVFDLLLSTDELKMVRCITITTGWDKQEHSVEELIWGHSFGWMHFRYKCVMCVNYAICSSNCYNFTWVDVRWEELFLKDLVGNKESCACNFALKQANHFVDCALNSLLLPWMFWIHLLVHLNLNWMWYEFQPQTACTRLQWLGERTQHIDVGWFIFSFHLISVHT